MIFHDVLRNLSIGDILDVAVTSCLIYLVLLWFKRAKAAFVAKGIVILAVFYFVARTLGMVLTTWIFHGFFAIFLIAMVVIFQEELRRFFERLATWGSRQKTLHPLEPGNIEALESALSRMARERVGALVVIKGRDPLDRHLEGGVELDGKLSEQLLESIFDPHSEGHDGAVVIENGRLTRFGVHLPLSKNLEKVRGLGTRHTAALGLCELTDALCVVVSEQKGTLSVARDGDLRLFSSIDPLKAEIADFLRVLPASPAHTFHWAEMLKKHAVEKVAAVGLAAVMWLMFVDGLKPTTQVFEVPVRAQDLPHNLRIKTIVPSKVSMTLLGLQRDFSAVDPDELRAYVDLDGVEPGRHHIPVVEENMHIPRTLRLLTVIPARVDIQVVPEPTP